MWVLLNLIPGSLVGGIMAYNGFNLSNWEFWAVLAPVALFSGMVTATLDKGRKPCTRHKC